MPAICPRVPDSLKAAVQHKEVIIGHNNEDLEHSTVPSSMVQLGIVHVSRFSSQGVQSVLVRVPFMG